MSIKIRLSICRAYNSLIYSINASVFIILALTTIIRAICGNTSSLSFNTVYYRIQSTPLRLNQSIKSLINAVNGTTIILVPVYSSSAGSINNILFPPPVGNIIINNSRLYIFSTVLAVFFYSFIFYFAFGPTNYFNPA